MRRQLINRGQYTLLIVLSLTLAVVTTLRTEIEFFNTDDDYDVEGFDGFVLDLEGKRNLTWWERKLKIRELPWLWMNTTELEPSTDERTLVDLAFPCEPSCFSSSGERKRYADCRLQCPNPIFCTNVNPEDTVSDVAERLKNQTCARNLLSTVKQKRESLVAFELKSGRKLFSLADVAVEIRRSRKPGNYRKSNVKIVFMGDSISRDLYDIARCHIMRAVSLTSDKQVQVKPNSHFAAWLPQNVMFARNVRNHLDIVREATFIVPSDEFSEPTHLTLAMQNSNRAIADDGDALYASCAQSDVMIITWGLHYADPHVGDFEDEMVPTLKTLKKCLESTDTTIFYAGHPMQHFFEQNPQTGWYLKNMPARRTCLPLPEHANRDDLDGWTKVMRSIEPNLFEPIPWSREARALCPKASKRRVIHWLPFSDLSGDLWRYHKRCSASTDCSHLRLLPHFGAPVWDAIFLAVAQDGRRRSKRCFVQTTPKYSSLARDRVRKVEAGTAGQVNQNVYNLFSVREEYKHDMSLTPFIQQRTAQIGRETIGAWNKNFWRTRNNSMQEDNMP